MLDTHIHCFIQFSEQLSEVGTAITSFYKQDTEAQES